jgi:hypothetical protein
VCGWRESVMKAAVERRGMSDRLLPLPVVSMSRINVDEPRKDPGLQPPDPGQRKSTRRATRNEPLVERRLAAQLRASAPGAKQGRANVLRNSNIDSWWPVCGPWQGMGGASSCGREFRSLDWCGERESFSGPSEGCVALSFERTWLRMGGLVSAGRIQSRQRAALFGVVRN